MLLHASCFVSSQKGLVPFVNTSAMEAINKREDERNHHLPEDDDVVSLHNLMDKTKETYISYLLRLVSDLADSRDTVDQEHYDLRLQDMLFLRVVSTSNICYFHFHVSLS